VRCEHPAVLAVDVLHIVFVRLQAPDQRCAAIANSAA
jgi:hypothetical protein